MSTKTEYSRCQRKSASAASNKMLLPSCWKLRSRWKLWKLILTTLILFSLSTPLNITSLSFKIIPAYADDNNYPHYTTLPICPKVELTVTSITNQTKTYTITDNAPIPIVPAIKNINVKITLPQGEAQNSSNYYGLYAHVAPDDQNHGWISQDQKPTIKKQNENSVIEFDFDQAYHMNSDNHQENIPLIPTSAEKPIDSELVIVPIYTLNQDNILKSTERLPQACRFSLKITNQCTAYEGFYFGNYTTGVALRFDDSLIPSGSLNDFVFTVDNNNSKEIPISNTSLPENKGFGLLETQENSPLKTKSKSLTLNLYYKKGGNKAFLCKTPPFVPLDQSYQNKLNQCQVEIGRNNNDEFNGKITVSNIPDQFFDLKKNSFVNIPYTESLIINLGNNLGTNFLSNTTISTTIKPYLYITDNDSYSQLQKIDNPIPGILEITNNFPKQVKTQPIDNLNQKVFTFNSVNELVDNLPAATSGYKIGVYIESKQTMQTILQTTILYSHIYLLEQCHQNFTVQDNKIQQKDKDRPINPNQTKKTFSQADLFALQKLCNIYNSNSSSYSKCNACVNQNKLWTALGCIDTDISGFVTSFFQIGLGLAGGIALLALIYGSFLVLTSAGNPETIQQGREIIISAITGLLLIIFSIFILKLIVSNILKIPGF